MGGIMKRFAQFVLASSMMSVITVPALAHHSAAAFNTQQEIKVTGPVTVYSFKNPHIYMTVQVRRPDGSTGLMEVESGAASVLNGLGFTKDSVRVGEVVTITGNPSRANPD